MITKKRKITIALIVLLSLSLAIFFLSKPDNDNSSILIGGSSTFAQYTSALTEEFMKENENVSIYFNSGGSTPGLIAVKNGAIDIATMSRDLNSNEDDIYIKNYLIGKDGVGIIVNPSNPITNLTIEQVKDIFSGNIDNWNMLGGKNSKISVIGRNSESTTAKGINEIVLKGAEFTKTTIMANSPNEMSKAVASNPNAIGFLSLKDLNSSVKVLDISGVKMSRSTILTDRYPISRSFYFVVYDKPDSSVKNQDQNNTLEEIIAFFKNDNTHELKIQTVVNFLDFVKSTKGQEIIEKFGAIAVH